MKNRYNDMKDNLESIKDIHGRIESLDQSIRSVNTRLRAVEKRLSVKDLSTGSGDDQMPGNEDVYYEIEYLRESIETLNSRLGKIVIPEWSREMEEKVDHLEKMILEGQATEAISLKEQFSEAQQRLKKLENVNRITIGRIKVPIELSGLIAAFVLIGTGYLIANDQWDIIRSFYYPVSLGVLFGAVVIAKFLITHREAI